MDAPKCIVLFSGGKDSLLSTIRVINKGYNVKLVFYDNGAGIGTKNIVDSFNRLKGFYGERIIQTEIVMIAGIWREFWLPYMNDIPSNVVNKWGELPVSQFNCLTCRSAMYVYTILNCINSEIDLFVLGSRKSQRWPIMMPSMIERFKKLANKYSVDILFPVIDLFSDWQLKNMIMIEGLVPKTTEPQCLIGCPLPYNDKPPSMIQKAVENYFDDCIYPRAIKIIDEQIKIINTSRLNSNGSINMKYKQNIFEKEMAGKMIEEKNNKSGIAV